MECVSALAAFVFRDARGSLNFKFLLNRSFICKPEPESRISGALSSSRLELSHFNFGCPETRRRDSGEKNGKKAQNEASRAIRAPLLAAVFFCLRLGKVIEPTILMLRVLLLGAFLPMRRPELCFCLLLFHSNGPRRLPSS
jgi:hypothetical protein